MFYLNSVHSKDEVRFHSTHQNDSLKSGLLTDTDSKEALHAWAFHEIVLGPVDLVAPLELFSLNELAIIISYDEQPDHAVLIDPALVLQGQIRRFFLVLEFSFSNGLLIYQEQDHIICSLSKTIIFHIRRQVEL